MYKKRSIGFLIIILPILFSNSCSFVNSNNQNKNAAIIYIRAGSMLAELPESLRIKANDIITNGWIDSNKELQAILTKNQKAIKEFKKAAKLAYCDFKLGKPVEKTYTAPEHTFKEFHLAKLIIIEGRSYEAEDKLDAALDNYLAVLRYSDHLYQQNNLICIMYATGIQGLLYTPLAEYINRANLSIKNYRFLLKNLLYSRKKKPDFEGALQENKEYTNELIREYGDDLKKRERYGERFFEQIYKEHDKLNDEYYRYLVTAYKHNRPEMYEEKIKRFKNELKTEIKASGLNLTLEDIRRVTGIKPEDFRSIVTPSLAGRIFFLYGVPIYCHNITKYHVSLSKLNILTTAIAVKLYELENGRLVDSLQKLIPTYFSELPEDPFNDFRAMKYERRNKEWVVYSYGPDREDNHGILKYGERNKDKTGDIVFSSS